MSVSAQRDTLNSTTLNATNCLITEDPSLMFSIVKAARDQRVPPRSGGKMRDPGNEVDYDGPRTKVFIPGVMKTRSANLNFLCNFSQLPQCLILAFLLLVY